ncbi:hypothetical protein GCM10010315_36750 [Streptomyces luteosporeus]|uniref:Uncharacterized protein n=1 Tax=Streptomyces luteosporeus TaxID=173856 RepID=A0ABN3TUA5_9ACTN
MPTTWSRTAPDGEELIDLAYEAAKAKLESQTSAFESLRTRASGVIAVAALVTSFSAGLGSLVNLLRKEEFFLHGPHGL